MTRTDLLICLRCDREPAFVLDTIDAVRYMTDGSSVRLVCAVDGHGNTLAKTLAGVLGEDHVFATGMAHGWGAGLYAMLAKAITAFDARFSFGHFMSIDYDTLFIKPGIVDDVLGRVDNPDIGLLGEHRPNAHWAAIFEKERAQLSARLGGIPRTYDPGEGIQGGCFVLTRAGLNELKRRGLLEGHWLNPRQFTTMADDHLIALLTKACRLRIVTLPQDRYSLAWRSSKDPVLHEKTGVMVFHPTKIRPDIKDRGAELRVRNHYRQLRGREPIT